MGRRRLHSIASALTGAVAAASVVYYFDASRSGGSRPAALERSAQAARRSLSRLQAASRDLAHRAYGIGAFATAWWRHASVPPPILVQRVRTRLGRAVSHPGAVHVDVDPQGTVQLSGSVLAWEHEPLRRTVAGIPGVRAIRDALQVYESAEHESALLGAPIKRRRQARGGTPGNGRPAALRLLMALVGSSLRPGGSSRRDTLGAAGASAGGAWLLPGVSGPRRHAPRLRGPVLEVCQTLRVKAPIERVYRGLRQADRLVTLLPAFRALLRHRPDGATRWAVHDPEGWPLEWTALITELHPNRQIAWRTTDDSMLGQSGMIWLEAIDPQQTRLHLYVSLREPPGRTGQALRRLLGDGPTGELTQTLRRLCQYLEGAAELRPGPSERYLH